MSTYVQNDFNWPKFSYVSFVNIWIINSHEPICFCKFLRNWRRGANSSQKGSLGRGESGTKRASVWRVINTQLFFFWFFLQNGRRRPFWMTENHFRWQFSPFQINTQLFKKNDNWPPAAILYMISVALSHTNMCQKLCYNTEINHFPLCKCFGWITRMLRVDHEELNTYCGWITRT